MNPALCTSAHPSAGPAWICFFQAVEKPFSSFDTSNPIILRQSFIAYTGVAAMTTTVSRQGIARKQVVFGQTNGLILGVSKDDLDVRRPKNKQEAEIATGLKPYSPLMAVEFPNYIGYNQVGVQGDPTVALLAPDPWLTHFLQTADCPPPPEHSHRAVRSGIHQPRLRVWPRPVLHSSVAGQEV